MLGQDSPKADPKFDLRVEPDHIGHVYQILSLAKMGVCTTDSCMNVDITGNSSLYEAIGRLAAEGIDLAETADRK